VQDRRKKETKPEDETTIDKQQQARLLMATIRTTITREERTKMFDFQIDLLSLLFFLFLF